MGQRVRVTQSLIEVLQDAPGNVRVTQSLVEVLQDAPAISPATPTGVGVTQSLVEVLQDAPGNVRISQNLIEVLQDAPGDARVTQSLVEVLQDAPTISPATPTGVGVTQSLVEILADAQDAGKVSSFQVAAVLLGPRVSSFPVASCLEQTVSGTFQVAAVLLGPRVSSFQVAAVLLGPRVSSFLLEARIGTPTVEASFPLEARIEAARIEGSFPVSSWLEQTVSGSFQASSWLAGRIDVAATIFATMGPRTWMMLDAVIVRGPSGGFPIEYRVYDPGRPDLYPPVATSDPYRPGRATPVKVIVNGVDISRHVVRATAVFTTKVNGAVGDCSFRVRDDAHELSFTFGQEINLLIDGVVRWGGWVMRPQRTFAMPVMPDPLTSPRIWQIEGVDYNIIFDKRVIHDSAKPNRAWNYDPGTYDDTVIRDVWKYFDMEGFTYSIERVGYAVLDIAGVNSETGGLVASGGFTLRDVLTSICRNTAAIFYCSPTKVITYLDSGSASSPYVLTDRPHGSASSSASFTDDFNRVVASGLGGDWVHGWGNDGEASVDGETAVIPALKYEGFINPSIPLSLNMTVEFDFWVQPVASQQGASQTYYYADFSRTWFDLYPTTIPSVSPFELEIELEYRPEDNWHGEALHHLMVEESSWYTIRVEQSVASPDGSQGGEARGMVWKTGSPEPSEWMFSHTSPEALTADLWPVEFEFGGSTLDVGRVDNFRSWLNYDYYMPPSNAVGYREVKFRDDSTEMCNDAHVWGAGYGGEEIVHSRHKDDESIGAHGRWQKGNFAQGVYKQATANALARSYVDGSPSARRAQKFPKRSVELVTDSSVFNAGDVVRVVNSAFMVDDVLPIRQARITFPTPYAPRYSLQMSWEIDADWAMTDPWIPPAGDGGGGGGGCEGCPPPPPPPPPPPTEERVGWFVKTMQTTESGTNYSDWFEIDQLDIIFRVPDDQGTTHNFDLFDRVVAEDEWGTSTDGHTWTAYASGSRETINVDNGSISVNGDLGIHRIEPTGDVSYKELLTDTDAGGIWTGRHWFMRERWIPTWVFNDDDYDRIYHLWTGMYDTVDSGWLEVVHVWWDKYGEGYIEVCIGDECGEPAPVTIPPGTIIETTIQRDCDDEGNCVITACHYNGHQAEVCVTITCGGSCTDVSGHLGCNDNTCGVTDTFTRTVSGGWGTSDAGLTWLDIPQSGELNDWSSEIPSGLFSADGTRGLMSNSDNLVGSGDPVQMLRVSEGVPYPIDVYFESQGIGPIYRDDDYVNLSFYFGPYFHWDIDSWLVFGSYYYQGNHHFHYTSQDEGGYEWNYTEGEYAVVLTGDLASAWCWRIQIDEVGARAKKWVKGTAEPDWQLGLTWTTIPTQNYFRNFAWELQAFNLSKPITQPVMAIDNVSISSINRCTQYRFDNFNRVVASGWGTGDFDHAWVAGSMGGVQLSVDGQSAKAVYPQNTVGLAPYRTLYATSGPWQEPSFTLTQRCQFTLHDRVLTSGYALRNTATGDELMVWMDPYRNNVVLQNEYALSTYVSIDFTFADGWYFLKWDVSPTETKVKVWAEGSAEPDWMGTIPAASISPDQLHAITQGGWHSSGGSATCAIDYIDFDYAGKPCCQDCAERKTTCVETCIEKRTGDPGVLVTDKLVALDPATRLGSSLLHWSPPSEWGTRSASYVPRSCTLYIDGLAVTDFDEVDPHNGIIGINIEVYSNQTVRMSYLTNGALP